MNPSSPFPGRDLHTPLLPLQVHMAPCPCPPPRPPPQKKRKKEMKTQCGTLQKKGCLFLRAASPQVACGSPGARAKRTPQSSSVGCLRMDSRHGWNERHQPNGRCASLILGLSWAPSRGFRAIKFMLLALCVCYLQSLSLQPEPGSGGGPAADGRQCKPSRKSPLVELNQCWSVFELVIRSLCPWLGDSPMHN